MFLSFDTFMHEYRVQIKGQLSYSTALGTDSTGNIMRIDNLIESFPKRLEKAKLALEQAHQQLETAKREVEKPFAQEKELSEKTARLAELDALLSLDKKENEIVGGEMEEGDAERQEPVREAGYER